ncbi:MAG: antibiotic biosynthesis monooxygenase [Deltaproteobacteria bacterium]|nr:antibiotic biosynthesis monooxygenase [Deltaproteobacteria bacterium]
MIVRLWHGRVDASKADEYAEFMKERAAPDYSSVDGLQKLLFLRKIGPEKAKYYPEDDQFLLEKEETSSLYEVFYEK